MVTRRRFLIFLLLSFAGLALAFIFPYRRLIEDRVAAPLAHALQPLQKLWLGLDGDMIWAFFMLIVYVAILLTFPTTRASSQRLPEEYRIQPENRLEFWRYQVRRLVSVREFSRLSVVELRKLVLDVIAFREQLDTRQEAENWLMAHAQQIPTEVMALFDRKMSPRPERTGRSPIQAWRRLWPGKEVPPAPRRPSEEMLVAILQFLENQFESAHDYYYR